MKQRALWSRREFVQSIGCSSLAMAAPTLSWAVAEQSRPRFVFVGFSNNKAHHAHEGIQVFDVRQDGWLPVQTVVSRRPASLALHPGRHLLYAVNEVDSYEGLPSGSVEAYVIDAETGHLSLINRQPLSLSATMPRHLAISPDGSSVVVAVHGGGAYNVLPIGAEGSLERVSTIVKEVGSGPVPGHQGSAHPQMVLFDTTGRHIIGSDLGSDRLNVFALTGNRLSAQHRGATEPGSGPGHIALHPEGRLLFVGNHLESSVSCYGYDGSSGKVSDRLSHQSFNGGSFTNVRMSAMTLHPSGRFLYTVHRRRTEHDLAHEGIAVWRVDSATGTLAPLQFWDDGLVSPETMLMAEGGRELLMLSSERGFVTKLHVNPISGRLSQPAQVATVTAPISIAVKYA